jgi:replication-associated recombination protein RarA
MKEKKEEEKKVDYEKVGYHSKDVVSALIKSIRLGRLEDALYWSRVMEAAGESTWFHFAVTMTNFAWEDCLDPMANVLADVAYRTLRAKKRWDENISFTIIDYLCRCRKFWECEDGVAREEAWYKIEDEIEQKGFTREIPSWALDRHSFTAWQTRKFDDRFSGTREGRAKMIKAYQEHGKLETDAS